VEITVMQDDENQYHNPSGYVYTDKMALELGAIWDGVDVLERTRLMSLDQIAHHLTLDWGPSVETLAMIGRRHA
jgi:hypothetical protein